ncbi:9350_t:CDS:2, partial [Dentiscutata heterogama]
MPTLQKKLLSLALKEVFEILANDIKTLYSCTQVNSEWFCEASPLLWHDLFSNKSKTHFAIGTYKKCITSGKISKDERHHPTFLLLQRIEIDYGY